MNHSLNCLIDAFVYAGHNRNSLTRDNFCTRYTLEHERKRQQKLEIIRIRGMMIFAQRREP